MKGTHIFILITAILSAQMKRIAIFVLATVAALVLLPAMAFFSYDALVFQPRQPDIQALLDRAQPEDRNPPALIRRYILAAHKHGLPHM